MKKILIVDDEIGIVDEIRDYLVEEGFEVHTADTGKDGIALLESVKPDLMLLDMKLPDMSGSQVLKLCKDSNFPTKVIVATGYVDQKAIDETEELGRDAFMQKPFNLEHLREQIDRLLG